jgi:chromosome partitioning protein
MIIASISYKGGVGKSTVAQNLAICFANSGYRTCIVDADETQATVSWTGVRFEKKLEPIIQSIGMTDHKAFVGNVKEQYKNYDVIIIDCPPSLSPIAIKAMYLSHLLIIPVTPRGGSDIWVTEKLLEKYSTIRDEKEGNLPAYFLINQFEPNVNLHKASLGIIKELEEEFEIKTLSTMLNKRVAYGEANVRGMGVYEYSDSKAKKEVIKLTKEILKIGEEI